MARISSVYNGLPAPADRGSAVCCDHVDGRMKPIKRFLEVSAAVIALSLGACASGADRSVADLILFRYPEPPKVPEYPVTEGDIKSKVKRDGYPDPEFLPNPDRLPELTRKEREAMREELEQAGRERMENRVMTCDAEGPADCVQ